MFETYPTEDEKFDIMQCKAVSIPMDEAVSLTDYYNKLSQVQISVRVAHNMQAEISHHMGNGGAVLLSMMRLEGTPEDKLRAFLNTSTELATKFGNSAAELMTPVVQDTMALNISTTRLITLVKHPEIMTRGNFDALSAFNDRLGTVQRRLTRLRNEGEIELMRASGIVPADFKLG